MIVVSDASPVINLAIDYLIGILSLAKQKGLIDEMRVVLDRLMNEAKFRIRQELYNEVLRNEGEL